MVIEWDVVVATLLSPLIALQVSEWIARRRQAKEEQLRVFKALMATRASPLDRRHVEALNQIDVVFSGNGKKVTEVRRLWKQYLDHLSDRNYPRDAWGTRRLELMVELLHGMAGHLGFDFDKTHIKNQCYYPDGYGDLENVQATVRNALAEIVSGRRSLPMHITNWRDMPQQ